MPIASLPPIVLILLLVSIALIVAVAIYAIVARQKSRQTLSAERVTHDIDRHHANPALSPRDHQEWERNGTFNPAAIMDDDDSVHLFYRAIGDDGLSTIGHASSPDGTCFDRRSSFPIYQPPIGSDSTRGTQEPKQYDPGIYTSGGGWGGHEDPRAVKIGDRVYMTYTAFQGWDSVRIAITSIHIDDLRKERWNWRKPRLISPAGEVHKNWVLFPEKINGKYAILHAVSPNILVDYVDNLDDPHPSPHIRSAAPRGGRKEHWDNWMRGAGAPPLKTSLGWLLLYHAMDRNDPNKYKLGVMILDTDDPTKIRYRSPDPILSPEMCYENDGKPGVVYASGAVIKDNELIVYYGGGDRHVCIARTNLESLLSWLMQYGRV